MYITDALLLNQIIFNFFKIQIHIYHAFTVVDTLITALLGVDSKGKKTATVISNL